MKFWLIVWAASLSTLAWAYIPPYSMIMSRTADNHGHGSFVVEQDVIYSSNPSAQLAADNQIIHETWTVIDENHMKVSFQGTGALKDVIKGVFIYDNSSRLAAEPGGGTKGHHVGEDWAEPFFYFRYSKPMRVKLVQMKIAPTESLKEKPSLRSDGPPEYQPEPYVHLARQNGIVAWTVSRGEGEDQPQLWIGQDQFLVTRVKLPSKTKIEAEDYAKFDAGIYLPRQRSYTWNNKTVTVQIRSVRSIGNGKPKDFSSPLAPFQFAGSDVLKEFYLRFR